MSAGIQLKIETNAPEVIAALRRLENRFTGRKPVLDAIGQHLVTSTHRRFEHERGPDGSPWKALSEAYVRRPKKEGGRGGSAHPILFLTGRRLSGRITFKATNDELAVGSNAKFPGGTKSAAAIHQLGGKAGKGGAATIPARPFLGIDAADEREIGRLVMRHLES